MLKAKTEFAINWNILTPIKTRFLSCLFWSNQRTEELYKYSKTH